MPEAIPGPGGPWRSLPTEAVATEPTGSPAIHREPLPPPDAEVYRRVTRPDMQAASAAARAMDPDHEPTVPGPAAVRSEMPTAPGLAATEALVRSELSTNPASSAAGFDAAEISAIHSEEATVPGSRAAARRAAAHEEPTSPLGVFPAEAKPAAHRKAPVLDEPTEPGPALVAPRRRPSVELPAEVFELHARPAALWRRLGAWVVDLAVQGALAGGAGAAALFSGFLPGTALPATNLSGLDLFMLRLHAFQNLLLPAAGVLVFAVFVYSTLFARVWSGRSPGRLLFGVRLVDARGLPPSAARALVRSVLSLISFALLLGGFWVSLFDRRGQTLHDRLTSTFVVRPS